MHVVVARAARLLCRDRFLENRITAHCVKHEYTEYNIVQYNNVYALSSNYRVLKGFPSIAHSARVILSGRLLVQGDSKVATDTQTARRFSFGVSVLT